MGKLQLSNLKKTIYYMKRNGLKRTFYAVSERFFAPQPEYRWTPVPEAELERQRKASETLPADITFSIVVPTYRTPERFLREMIESVRGQTYPRWELILADASCDPDGETPEAEQKKAGADSRGKDSAESCAGSSVRRIEAVAASYKDERIRYVKLAENRGISENTNEGLKRARGSYVGLLDHDDVLTPDALYEMAARICGERERGIDLQLLYSDEDKCSGDGREYFEPHFKEKFNQELLFSNNYICHFLVMRRKLIQGLMLRGEYDGAQDYDLVLRAVRELSGREEEIAHVSEVLYHWRCHTASTAQNPQSKLYAYDAGRRAMQDFADKKGWNVRVADTAHVGFYRIVYGAEIFSTRPDVGAVGGPVIKKGRIVGGRINEKGEISYAGLREGYSGYLHRASLGQDAEALDLRNLRVRPECRELFEKVTGLAYAEQKGTGFFDASRLPEGFDAQKAAIAFGQALRESGYRLLYLPEYQAKVL